MSRMIGAIVGASERAEERVATPENRLAEARNRAKSFVSILLGRMTTIVDRKSCPIPVIARPQPKRRSRLHSGRSRFARRVMPMM
jgi:hypothetical protein